ncbi:hypothetical protein IAU59_004733 [Kwoniella sp. CBS 9459]
MADLKAHIMLVLTYLLLISTVIAVPLTDKHGDLPEEETDWYRHMIRDPSVPVPTTDIKRSTSPYLLLRESVEYGTSRAERAIDGGILAYGDSAGIARSPRKLPERSTGKSLMGDDNAIEVKVDLFRLCVSVREGKEVRKRMERANKAPASKGSDVVTGFEERSASWDDIAAGAIEGKANTDKASGLPKVGNDDEQEESKMERLEKRPFCATCLRGFGIGKPNNIFISSGDILELMAYNEATVHPMPGRLRI